MDIDLDMIINRLNSMLEADPDTMNWAVKGKTFCNQALADHPTAQVEHVIKGPNEGSYKIGLLGWINGMLGVYPDGWGPVAGVFDNDRLIRFQRTKPKE